MSLRDEADIEAGLMAMALCNGVSTKAQKMLAVDGIKIDPSTLRRWAFDTHTQRYEEIRAQHLPRLRARIADKSLDLAERAMEINAKILQRMEQVDEMPAKELHGASRNMAVVAGVHIEKSEALNDRPTVRVAIDLAGTIRELKSLGVEFIEGTATEELPAAESDTIPPAVS